MKDEINISFRLGKCFTDRGINFIEMETILCFISSFDEIELIANRGIPKVMLLKRIRALIDVELQEMTIKETARNYFDKGKDYAK